MESYEIAERIHQKWPRLAYPGRSTRATATVNARVFLMRRVFCGYLVLFRKRQRFYINFFFSENQYDAAHNTQFQNNDLAGIGIVLSYF